MRLEKPVIVSLGMANLNEIEDIIHLAESLNFKDLIFMICTCCYPAPIEEINLATIPHLREKYGINIGFSDHSLGLTAAIASVALGAVTIEKHFMLSESEDPLDECVSIDEKSLVDLVSMTKDAFKALGKVAYGVKNCEQPYTQNRRSLYFTKDLKEGDLIKEGDIQSFRPSSGLSPKHLKEILGLKATKDLSFGDPVTWDVINK